MSSACMYDLEGSLLENYIYKATAYQHEDPNEALHRLQTAFRPTEGYRGFHVSL